MRFLCLHGMGTNADIFESQLAPIISQYSSTHTFDFIDAPHECPPAPGISEVFPPPYLAWQVQYEPEQIEEAHSFLKSVIEEDGPYDGVIGFSQGAALAASFILCDEYHGGSSGGKPPFQMAAFFNCVMLFSPSQEIGTHIGEQVRQMEEKHAAFLEGREVESTTTKTNDVINISPSKDIYGFVPDTFPIRISIPTFHVIGAEDQFQEYSRALIGLCQADKTEVFTFEGGHEIPRSKADVQKCVDMLDMVVMMASLST
ncbi:hypothetical protein N431DRAFT_477623 [Stipitochalara longipes BDJ]|nr:hypothetical protein N431DRAFT_477623 [Stipitochalara longipes BDJ]